MKELERTIYLNNLISIYGGLLTDTQKGILSDYYELNLSLSEIAENRGISRAAVDDALKKGIKKLEGFEKELKIYQNNQKVLKNLAKIKDITENSDILKIIEETEEIL